MTAVDAVNSRIQQLAASLAALSGGPAGADTADGAPFAAALAQAQGTAGAASGDSSDSGPGATLPAGVTGQDIVADAQKYLGIPYVFGGQSSSGMDCSGLVRQVLGELGLDVGHSVVPQAGLGTPVASLADAQPGDLIVTKGDEHVAIYAGKGQIIEAPRADENVVQRANWIDPSQIATIRRVTSAAGAATGMTAPDAATLSQLAAATGLPAAAMQQLLAQLPGEGSARGASSTAGAAASADASPRSVAGTVLSASAQAALSGLASIAAAPAAGDGGDGAGDAGTSGQQGGDAALLSTLAALAGAPQPSGAQPSSFAAAAAAASASNASPASAPTLTQQLSQPIAALAREPGTGDQTVVVRVSPEQYGPITVTAHSDATGLHIQLTAPSGAGHDALAATMTELRRDLASNGISASLSLGTSTAGADGGAAGQNGGGQQAQQAALELLARSQDQALGFGAQAQTQTPAQTGFGGGGQNGQNPAQTAIAALDSVQQLTVGADLPMVSIADATEGAIDRNGTLGLDVLA